MSTLQVANVHLESTGNNRIQYSTPNTVNIYTAGTFRLKIDDLGAVYANGTIDDQAGDVRDLVNLPKTSAYVPTAADNGKMINITTGGITINGGVFANGQNITIYNNSASSQTITQGAGVTLRLAGTATTGSRTLALRGIATILCVSLNEFVCSGAGLS